jgi:hypothetical protein
MKKITDKRLAEIKEFKVTDFSDAPELTDEQLVQMKPSHLRKEQGNEMKQTETIGI